MGNNVHEKIEQYIKLWKKRCYKNGLPDESPIQIKDKVPSYKNIALAILKNDFTLNSLGFKPKKTKYYSILKRIELDDRKYIGKQLKLNL